MRSEVTGDAEPAGEAVRVAVPIARHEELVRLAPVVDRAEEAARLVLVRALVHQLEVEVQVGDRVPADIGANQPGRRALRHWALRELRDAAAEAQDVAAAAHVA